MRISNGRKNRIISDLGLNIQFVKGQEISVRNCWHFYTDGNAVDSLFRDEEDFRDGMNRIYKLSLSFDVDILAFVLMDTHVHFALHGEFDQCIRFLHEFIRLTSYLFSKKYGEKNKFANLKISYQQVRTAKYLKTVICYIIKNPPAGGLPFTAYDYPWSSGPLMFRSSGSWASPQWLSGNRTGSGAAPQAGDGSEAGGGEFSQLSELSGIAKKTFLKSKAALEGNARLIDGIVFPGEYVLYEIAEALFRTCRSFNYFMCMSKDSDVDALEGFVSSLSIPIQEMRQHKNELCLQMFGKRSIRDLGTDERIRLAKALKCKYNSSLKQICRLCGISYDEVRGIL